MGNALPYLVYDADNHFYESADAITRHLPKKYGKAFQLVQVNGRTKLAINGQISDYIPNPTFDVVAAPGAHLKYYRAENTEGLSLRELTGAPIHAVPSFRNGADRLPVMDAQNVYATLMFPTLFSAIERRMSDDHELLNATLHSLNQWTDEEWGFDRQGRIFATPVISLADVDLAVKELEWSLKHGARSVILRPAPVPGYRGSRSMGFKEFDPFWALINESKIFVSLHASDSGYDLFTQMWTGGQEWTPFAPDPFANCQRIIDRAISDTVSALICHGVFDRHPNVRIACIENGAFWVDGLIKTFDHVYGQMPQSFKQHPTEVFKRHFFVAPFNEDSTPDLVGQIGANRVLFGSDWPHPEGVVEPLDFLAELKDLGAADQERIMSSNLKGLLEGVRD
jgi:predicted TIM-barrel fold metal-dependent hydrolase